MEFFFVGLAMRSRDHDYGPIHAALLGMQAKRVSTRIWLCAVPADSADAIFGLIARSLSPRDEVLIVQVPQNLLSQKLLSFAA